jgi:hypothetical protein
MDNDELDTPLHKQATTSRSVALAPVLSDRLDKLCALVNREGSLRGTIYRKDLVAALIALAPEDLGELEGLMENFVDLRTRDALVGDEKNADVVELRPAKPGRRSGD